MADWFVLLSGAAILLGTAKVLVPFVRVKRGSDDIDTGHSNGGAIRTRVPLKDVVTRCEARWFLEDLKRAMDGDAGAMIRVGHMLLAGYGVKQDKQEAGKWLRQCWAIQNYQDTVGVEIMDTNDSVVPCLGWGEPSGSNHSKQQQEAEADEAKGSFKSIGEIYDLFEDTLKEQRLVDQDFSKDVKHALVRQQWSRDAAAAAEEQQQQQQQQQQQRLPSHQQAQQQLTSGAGS